MEEYDENSTIPIPSTIAWHLFMAYKLVLTLNWTQINNN